MKTEGLTTPGAKRHASRLSRPHVLVNMAMTADGKIATVNHAVTSFGSPRDHEHLLELRSTVDAVLCGATTAQGANVTLDAGPRRFRRKRLERGLAEHPLRVIASGSGHLDSNARIFQHKVSPVIVLTTRRASRTTLERLRGLSVHVGVFGEQELDLQAALVWLRRQWRVQRLVCEGGGQLNDAMFRSGLVDELHLTVCPKVFGGKKAPTIADGAGFSRLAEAVQLRLRSRRVMGDEMFLVYDVAGSGSRLSARRAINQSTSERRLK